VPKSEKNKKSAFKMLFGGLGNKICSSRTDLDEGVTLN
jgi:hypothetical protein